MTHWGLVVSSHAYSIFFLLIDRLIRTRTSGIWWSRLSLDYHIRRLLSSSLFCLFCLSFISLFPLFCISLLCCTCCTCRSQYYSVILMYLDSVVYVSTRYSRQFSWGIIWYAWFNRYSISYSLFRPEILWFFRYSLLY
jgi:hypothetical protein